MANVSVEIRWTDDEERQSAETAVEDVGGQVVNKFDGLLVAEVPDDSTAVLKDRRLVYSFPKPPGQGEAGLASAATVDPFPTRVKLTKLTEDAKSALKVFTDKTLRVGLKKAQDAFILRKEPRTRRNPTLDGPDTDLSWASPTATMAADAPEPPDDLLPDDAYIIKLSGPIEPKWQEELETIAPLGDHRPPETFRMMLTPGQLARVQSLPFVERVKRYGLLDTLTPAMVQLLDSIKPSEPAAVGHFDVTVHLPEAVGKVVSLLEKSGIKVVERSGTSLRFEARVDSPILAAIAQLPIVRTITPFATCDLFLDQARVILGLDDISQQPPQPGFELWDGSGEIVAVFDSGIDATHPDIKPALAGEPGRFRDGVPNDTNGHGTHVAGIIAGRGTASNGQIRGVAPGARVRSFSIMDAGGKLIIPLDLGEMLKLAVDSGAKVINLSWGKKLRADYDVYGESIDRFARANPEILVVVAAGNEGESVKEQGPRLGFHRPKTIGMPAAAKNVLTVGACCNRDRIPPFAPTWGELRGSQFPDPPAGEEPVVAAAAFPAAISSRGPTGFDAVKPDLLAPGTLVLSARGGNAALEFIDHPLPAAAGNGVPRYGYLNGTSMAAPMVAGAAVLLRQFLRVKHNTTNPSAALLKALLILAAVRIQNANSHSVLRDAPPVAVGFPDFDQGFGVLNLRNVLPHSTAPKGWVLAFHEVANDSAAALEARVESDSPRRSFRPFKVEAPADSAAELRVALAWTDVSGRGVQNLLTLEVKQPDGMVWIGNPDRQMFLDEAALALGAAPIDKHNTVQLVTIKNPKKGAYRITVRAEATTAPPQGYALVVLGPVSAAPLKPLF